MRIRNSLLGLTAGAMALVGAAPVAMAGEFDGVTVNILTRPGYSGSASLPPASSGWCCR